jgi:cyclin T
MNTAIVYMHRFYVFHPFTLFCHGEMAAACLFLACKVEEQPRAVEDIIKIAYRCLHPDQPSLYTMSQVSEL